MGSTKLRELIRQIRNAKTLQEERSIVAKESALIRTDLKAKNCNKPRNVAKLMYMHMMGYETRFGQLECINLITSPNYPEKRIGYLALMILLDETQEVLPLIEHSLKKDLGDKNQFIQALALTALGNIGSSDICQDLCFEVEKLLMHSPYVRKKAALCAVRIIQKNPELADQFIEKIGKLLKEHNHGALLTSVVLVEELIKVDPEENMPRLKVFLKQILTIMKSLVMSAFVLEHDVQGVADPFLQVRIIRLLRYFGKGNQKASQKMTDILAQVATNTDDGINPGNAILYECANTIMEIESEKGLRDMAINILSKFLVNRDNNLRYVALNSLRKVISKDPQSVTRYTSTIMDCLMDHDISIRKRAVDLLLLLVTPKNYQVVMKKFIAYLSVTTHEEKENLTGRIGRIIDQYGSTAWKIQTYLDAILVSGRYTRPQMADSFIALLTQADGSHGDVTLKLYQTVEKLSHSPFDFQKSNILLRTCVWCIGEYGEALHHLPTEEVLNLLIRVLSTPSVDVLTRSRALTAVVKLSKKYPNHAEKCYTIVNRFKRNVELELQSRACEYSTLMKFGSDVQEKVLADHPAIENQFEQEEEQPSLQASHGHTAPQQESSAEGTLLEMLSDDPVQPTTQTTNPQPKEDDLFSFLTSDEPISQAPIQPTTQQQPQSSGDMFDEIFGSSQPQQPTQSQDPLESLLDIPSGPQTSLPQPIQAQNVTTQGEIISFLQENGVQLELEILKPDSVNHPERTTLIVHYSNSHTLPLTNVDLRVKVPKYLKMKLFKASSPQLPGHCQRGVHQKIQIINSMQGQKKIILKYQLVYTSPEGQSMKSEGSIMNIPNHY